MSTLHFNLFTVNAKRLWLLTLLLALLVTSLLTHASQPVGKVIFAVGQVSLTRGNTEVTVERGIDLYTGDSITSGDDGHAHLLMSDNGFFSIRPNSQMTIVAYQYTPDEPEKSRIKIKLDTGVMRAITGSAGQANKKGYRVNTPVAAIGVRGTDYTVMTTDVLSRLSVRSGGVVMSPFSNNCTSTSSGPCNGQSAAELFARDKGAVLEARLGSANAVISYNAPAPDEITPPLPEEQNVLEKIFSFGSTSSQSRSKSQSTVTDNTASTTTVEQTEQTEQAEVADSSANNSTTTSETVSDSKSDTVVDTGTNNSHLAESNQNDNLEELSRQEQTDQLQLERNIEQLATEISLQGNNEILPNNANLMANPTIIWGHRSPYQRSDSTQQRIADLIYRTRHYVGINAAFVLAEDRLDDKIIPDTGRAFFKMNSYEAYVKRDSSIETAQLSNAALIIDFDESRFATSINLHADSLDNPVTIQGSGNIEEQGSFFSDQNSDALIQGVFGSEAAEAGYLFDYEISEGVDAIGATHWINTSLQN